MTLDETTRFRITNKFVGILGDEDAAKLPMMTNLWNRIMRAMSALKVANSFLISARNSVV